MAHLLHTAVSLTLARMTDWSCVYDDIIQFKILILLLLH